MRMCPRSFTAAAAPIQALLPAVELQRRALRGQTRVEGGFGDQHARAADAHGFRDRACRSLEVVGNVPERHPVEGAVVERQLVGRTSSRVGALRLQCLELRPRLVDADDGDAAVRHLLHQPAGSAADVEHRIRRFAQQGGDELLEGPSVILFRRACA